ncbi:MAG: hypothetical protein DMF97_12565, partial [Acidobacteria bacterium]
MIDASGIGAPVASRTSPAIVLLPLGAANADVRAITTIPEATEVAALLSTPNDIYASPEAHAAARRAHLIEHMDWKT